MGGSEQPDGPTRTELIEAFLAVVNAFTPEATIVALRAHADVLKSDGIEAIFSDAAAKYSDNPEAAGILEHRRQLLRFYRQFGMVGAEAALGPDPAPEVAAAVLRVAAAANWRDKLAALKTDASLIATPAGSRAALVLAWRNFENPDAVSEIQRTQGLLEMAVERGVDATIAHITERVRDLAFQPTDGGLDQWARNIEEALALTDPQEEPRVWIALQLNLGQAIVGDKDRGEARFGHGIERYQAALSVATARGEPDLWSAAHLSLGDAFMQLADEKRLAEVAQALDHYRLAGQTANPDTERLFHLRCQTARALLALGRYDEALPAIDEAMAIPPPVDEAQLLYLLELARSALLARIGDAEWLEKSVRWFERTLQALSERESGEISPLLHLGLSFMYLQRVAGDRAENLELAIEHGTAALAAWPRSEDAYRWAQAKHNIGAAYLLRVRGERADNLEQAISLFNETHLEHTLEAHPHDWAMTANALAQALTYRLRGNPHDNLQQAVALASRALQVWDRRQDAFYWAESSSILANCLYELPDGATDENLETALAHFQDAASIYTLDRYPDRGANALNNIAALLLRLAETQPRRRAEALDSIRKALAAVDRSSAPYTWAVFRRNLGALLAGHHREYVRESGDEALAAFRAALEVFTLEAYPREHAETQGNTGMVLLESRHWEEALAAYDAATVAEELLFGDAFTESGRRSQVEQLASYHILAAYCLLKLGRVEEALTRMEAGKARVLADALQVARLGLAALPEAEREAMNTARNRVAALEMEMRFGGAMAGSRSSAELGPLLQEARSSIREHLTWLQTAHPELVPGALTPEQILELAPSGGALVSYLVTFAGSAAVIVPHGVRALSDQHVVWLDLTDDGRSQILVGDEEHPGWLRAYANDRTEWRSSLPTRLAELWEVVCRPVAARLEALGVAPGAPLVLLPQGGLGLLPLHAAAGPDGALVDRYVCAYAPSAYALRLSQQQAARGGNRAPSLLAVADTVGNLPFAELEATWVAARFEADKRLALFGEAATGEALLATSAGVSHLHFACHGFYDWTDPLASGLLLAGGGVASLAAMISPVFDLSSARLVTLSACETGLVEFSRGTDEYLGLPAGFLQAGAAAVISTLWSINDISSALLIDDLYRRLMNENCSVAHALGAAQRWLRDMPRSVALELIGPLHDSGENQRVARALDALYWQLVDAQDEWRPFADPFHWAAYTAAGAALV